MLALFKTGEEIGGRKVDMSHPGWASLAALFATMAQTGFRKAEVCLAAGASWTKANISLANVSWLIDGHIVVYPTVEQLRNLKKGDYCLLRPPPSKADPLGLHWGASTIYLRFDPDAAICAAKYIAWMEITRAVPAAQRAEVPSVPRVAWLRGYALLVQESSCSQPSDSWNGRREPWWSSHRANHSHHPPRCPPARDASH